MKTFTTISLFLALVFILGCGGEPKALQNNSGGGFKLTGTGKVSLKDSVFVLSAIDTAGKVIESKTASAQWLKLVFTEATANAGGGIGVIILEDTAAIPVRGQKLIISVPADGFELEKIAGGPIVIYSGSKVVAKLDGETCTTIYLKKVVEGGVAKVEVWAADECVQL